MDLDCETAPEPPDAWTFFTGDLSITGFWYRARGADADGSPVAAPPALLVLAPGAGARQSHPFMTSLARALAARGVDVMTFDFPYSAAGRRRPDPQAILERAWRDALVAARARHGHAEAAVFVGGKSMGGRLATHLAASLPAGAISGVVCFGYPLHPPQRRAARPVDHFGTIAAPVLILQGTRDAFGGPADVRQALESAPQVVVVEVEGADHGFAVPRRSGRTAADVIEGLAATADEWMRRTA